MKLLRHYLNRPNLIFKFRKNLKFPFLETFTLLFLVFLLRTACRHVFRTIHWSDITMFFCNNTRLFCNRIKLLCMSKKFWFALLVCNRLSNFCDSTQLSLAVKIFLLEYMTVSQLFTTWKEQKIVLY